MGRYYWDKKDTADGLKSIDIAKLKEWQCLNGWNSNTITWTDGWGNKSSVSIEVSTASNDKYIRIHYTQTDNHTGEKKNFDYKHGIITTPCNYGGVRYWFICQLYRNRQYCGKRVRKLYKGGDHFGCRHCYDLSYDSRNESPRFRIGPFAVITLHDKIRRLEETIKRPYYAGKPTRKQRQLTKLQERCFTHGLSLYEAEEGIFKSLTQRK